MVYKPEFVNFLLKFRSLKRSRGKALPAKKFCILEVSSWLMEYYHLVYLISLQPCDYKLKYSPYCLRRAHLAVILTELILK